MKSLPSHIVKTPMFTSNKALITLATPIQKSLEGASLNKSYLKFVKPLDSWPYFCCPLSCFYFCPHICSPPQQPSGFVMNTGSWGHASDVATLQPVLSGVCSRDQRRWRILQVILTDLENQRGSSFCLWLVAMTWLCLAWLKYSAAQDRKNGPLNVMIGYEEQSMFLNSI